MGLLAKMILSGKQGIKGLRDAPGTTLPWMGIGMHICTPVRSRKTGSSEKGIGLWRSLRGEWGCCMGAVILVDPAWCMCRGSQRHVTPRGEDWTLSPQRAWVGPGELL